MSEPITLYGPTGEVLTVYGKAQAAAMESEGYSVKPPEPATEPADVSVAPESRRVGKATPRPGK